MAGNYACGKKVQFGCMQEPYVIPLENSWNAMKKDNN